MAVSVLCFFLIFLASIRSKQTVRAVMERTETMNMVRF
jgi:hypothetical protein